MRDGKIRIRLSICACVAIQSAQPRYTYIPEFKIIRIVFDMLVETHQQFLTDFISRAASNLTHSSSIALQMKRKINNTTTFLLQRDPMHDSLMRGLISSVSNKNCGWTIVIDDFEFFYCI